mgnify:FL=1
MSSSNYRRNKAAIDQFRKELMAMVDDIREIDQQILNRAVNAGVKYAKNNSPVITGFYRKNWRSAPAVKAKAGGVTKHLVNSADYASYVNYGHRTVDKDGNTTGYVKSKKGDHLLERTVNYAGKQLEKEFKKEVEAVQNRHN